MDKYNIVEADKYCRLCLSDDGQMEQIFGDGKLSFVDRIYECTSIKLADALGMPTSICCQCRSKLDIWSSFRELCLSSDDFLLKAHSNEILSIEIKDETVETSDDDGQLIEHDTSQEELNLNSHEEVQHQQFSESPAGDEKKKMKKSKNTKRSSKDEKPKKIRQKKQCPICLKWVASVTHHMSFHNQRNFQCEVCSKMFYQLSNLTQHMKVHTGERPHSCEICPKRFASSCELAIHRRMHTGEKPYCCHVCGKSFVTSSHLTRHTRIHLGTKAYKCDTCSKSFTNSGHLSRHRRIHTGEKPYSCSTCPASFARCDYLKAHRCKGLV